MLETQTATDKNKSTVILEEEDCFWKLSTHHLCERSVRQLAEEQSQHRKEESIH